METLAATDRRRRRVIKGTDVKPSPLITTLPALLLYLAAGLWYLRPSLGPWPLSLVALGWLLRLVITDSLFPRTSFDGALALFLVAAAAGASISVDRATAWSSIFWLYAGAVVMYYAVIVTPERVKIGPLRFEPLRILLIVLPSLVAVYFLLTTDWQAWTAKVGWLGSFLDILAELRQQAPGHLLHPNVAGGLIAAFLPLQLGALRWGRSPWWLRIVGLLLVSLSLLGLVVSSSRGALMGLLAAVAAWLLWQVAGVIVASLTNKNELANPQRGRAIIWGILVAVAALIGVTILAATPLGSQLLQIAGGSRLTLWSGTLDLVRDTPLTGLGFDGFQMAYVSYVLLLHVGYQPHSHNLLLEIWLRQGLLGLIVLGWMIVTVIRLRKSSSRWRPWALASLTVIAIHGMFDIPLYGARGMMLAFIPLALLTRTCTGEPIRLPRRANLTMAVAAVLVVAGALLVFLPAGRAVIYANLAAVAQTRAELSRYTWPEWPIQDELRRSPEIDLAPAIARYQAALAANPNNASANRRLAQIELARGDYASARAHLEASYAAAPSNRATRQLLAELYAIDGESQRAAELLSTVDTSLNQLDLRVFWYTHIGEQEKAEQLKQLAGD